MAVKLRLRREGTHNEPHYRIVAADSRSPRNGRFIEILGEYHPMDEPSTVVVERERALYWLGVGAQPTDQVKKLLRIEGIWEEFKPGDAPARVRPEAAEKMRAREQSAATAGEAGESGDAGDTGESGDAGEAT